MQWSASIVAAYAASYLLAAPLGARFPGVSTLEGSKRIVTFIHAIISTIGIHSLAFSIAGGIRMSIIHDWSRMLQRELIQW